MSVVTSEVDGVISHQWFCLDCVIGFELPEVVAGPRVKSMEGTQAVADIYRPIGDRRVRMDGGMELIARPSYFTCINL
jgi:hypothetical protein